MPATYDRQTFLEHAAKAFFVDYWLKEPVGPDDDEVDPTLTNEMVIPAGSEILDYAPETEPWARKLAASWLADLEHAAGEPLDRILERWLTTWEAYPYSDRPADEEHAGWYAAMQAMGHGVGLHDFGIEDQVPYCEAYPR